MKEKGILLPIFSLPSKYGVGDFGYEAREFIDILHDNNVVYWEVLPINSCESLPYSPLSYYAIDEDQISLDLLKDMGLIESAETRESTEQAIYDDFKIKYFKEAYSKFEKNEEYEEFIKCEEIQEYAEYITEKDGETKEYHLFLQYIAYVQWMQLKEYANSKNVKIIGDMPVYPTFDSAETKYHPECFQMKDGEFTFESGTPPDYYNSDGQKWGSPVYDITYLRNTNYEYLIKRMKYNMKLFDKLRIDYFRGYDSFFKIPYGRPGREGFYEPGLSYAFFDELFKDGTIKKDDLIIEDLGDIREETIRLREHYDFTRQKILQFSIDLDNYYDRDNFGENVVIFPGNHDCHTIHGWYKILNEEYREKLKEFLRRNECYDINVNIGIMQYCMKCRAKIAILAVQDVLGLDDSARINKPGVVGDENWSWKLIDFNDFKERIKDFN